MADRESTIRRIAARLTSDWSSGPDYPLDSFLTIYSPTVEWYDHAYRTIHFGHAGLEVLRKHWLGANEGLKVETRALYITSTGFILQIVTRGTFSGDIRNIRKATGKTFAYQACLVVDVDDHSGLVTKVEEYYSFLHDDGVEIVKYTGADMLKHKL